MSEHSKIEWTDATWNPLRGCIKISPGCKHCYAENFAERFRGVQGHPYQQGFDLRLVPDKLLEPFHWSSPKTVFVNSMSDLFQPDVPDEYIEDVVSVRQILMVEANWHTYQVLTKRSERLMNLLSTKLSSAAKQQHIWWGVSVEDKRYGLPRIEHLRRSAAAVKFLSIEPLLEDLGEFDISGMDWAIVGGESGHGARSMHKDWVENIFALCKRERVIFFFKQWGGVHKSTTGRMLHGKTYDEMPERIVADIPETINANEDRLRCSQVSKKTRALMAKCHETKIALWQQAIKKKGPATARRHYRESFLAGD